MHPPSLIRSIGVLAILVCAGILVRSAQAQLRVVTYNTLGNPTSSADMADWNVVLQAIGNQNVNGVANRIGIMALQEVDEPTDGANAQNTANLLNSLYGVSSYQASIAPSGEGFNLQAFVYDTSQVDLLGTFIFDIGTRPSWRGRFRPVGYTSPAAEFYVYSSHFKAFPEFESTRASEAALLRSNGNNLGQGTNIIYAGDYNLTGGAGEQAYTNMLSSGNGQAIDPENGDFSSPLKRSWSSSSPVSRLDFQFITTELEDDEGLDLVDGSYRVFGRVERSPGNIITSPIELTDASDHLPVVADYQLPAVLSAVAGMVPATLDVGQIFNFDLTVQNAASVLQPIGADELDYSVTTSGDLVGSYFDQMDAALGGGNVHSIGLGTATPGMKSGMITIASPSQAVQNGLVQIPVSYEVIAATLDGDFNGDGTVDAVDYAAWRDGLGSTYTEDDYLVWKNNYGQMLGSGGAAAVPEPSAALLLVGCACWLAMRPVKLKAWSRTS